MSRASNILEIVSTNYIKKSAFSTKLGSRSELILKYIAIVAGDFLHEAANVKHRNPYCVVVEVTGSKGDCPKNSPEPKLVGTEIQKQLGGECGSTDTLVWEYDIKTLLWNLSKESRDACFIFSTDEADIPNLNS